MKYRLIFLLMLILNIYKLSIAQDSIKIKLVDLKTPTSPAFVLLGIEPTSIEKPTTPRAVAASFISTVRQGGAIVIAPYWLASHPKLKFDEYYNASMWQTIKQTLSISFATMPRSDDTDTLGTQVGVGFRWMFVAGGNRDSLKIYRNKLKEIQSQILETEESSKIYQLERDAQKIALAIQQEDKKRIGFSLEMASAFTMNFLNDDFNKGKFNRWGIWLTGAFSSENPPIDFLIVTRLIGNQKQEAVQNVFDFGGRLIYTIEDFSISFEYINRSEISTSGITQSTEGISGFFFLKNTYRMTSSIGYHYNKDISIYFTFGKDYAGTKANNDPLLAQVGINLGFGEIPVLERNKK